jgi:hypothetical protein
MSDETLIAIACMTDSPIFACRLRPHGHLRNQLAGGLHRFFQSRLADRIRDTRHLWMQLEPAVQPLLDAV